MMSQVNHAEAAAVDQGMQQEIKSRFMALADCLRSGKPEQADEHYQALLTFNPEALELFWYRNQRKWEEEKRLFLRFNNDHVAARFADHKPQNILLLLPFCLQMTSCPHRIVWDTDHCQRCGACPVGEVLELAELKGADVRVAIRGIFAPKFIRELRPDLTIAVACSDELFQGVLRVTEMPCYAVLNEQPEGYCINTEVDLERVAAAFKLFT
jgi:hypothetical protein